MKIVLLDPSGAAQLDRFRPFLPKDATISSPASRQAEDQIAAISQADFAITADVAVTDAMFAAAGPGGLKAVHKWGVGYDNIDLAAARAAAVRVLRTAGSNSVPVAETALAMMLALQRNLVRGHMAMQDGRWIKNVLSPESFILSGRTIGIVGFGYIGQRLARLLAGFGCEILYHQRTRLDPAVEAELNARHVSLDELLALADIVSLHCPLSDMTRNLFNAAAFAKMKPGSSLVNLARGGIVVENDLADAIESGHLRGAAIDVFSIEPVQPGNRLVGLERVIVTPHIGALAADLFPKTVARMMANFSAIARGDEPDPCDILV